MKTILALAAALPLLAHAVTFDLLECTIKDVKVTDTLGMFTDGDWFHKKRIGKTFFVDRELGRMVGALTNIYHEHRVVKYLPGLQAFVVIGHDGDYWHMVSTLHIWISDNPEYSKDGYPFTYSPDVLREFYSGTCRQR